jgi:CRP-like cAMP-binding protein
VQEAADAMYIVMEGSVNLFSKSPQEDDAYVPIDWTTVKLNLQSAQRSLDAVKLIASVPQASELQSIKKPDEDEGLKPVPSQEPKTSNDVPVSGLAVYDDDESGHRFNARKTWGRLFGGIKLGAVVSHVTEELEKAGKKMHSRGLESTYIGRVDVGDSFGEGGLIRRRPSGRVVFCYFRGFRCILLPIFCVMNSVRHCTAVARYNCTLLVISVDDYMKLQETGLMTSECQR